MKKNMFFLCFLGTLTGVGGGLLRDMMAGVPPYIFVKACLCLCIDCRGGLQCTGLPSVWADSVPDHRNSSDVADPACSCTLPLESSLCETGGGTEQYK